MKKLLGVILMLALLAGMLVPVSAEPKSAKTRTEIGRPDHVIIDGEEAAAVFEEDWPEAPEVEAEAAILIELNSGIILYEKNATEKLHPASLTKIMTAMLAIENLIMTDTLTLSHASVTDLAPGGFDTDFAEGETMYIRDALYALSLKSVNTIAYALAERVSGSVSQFASLMNSRAWQIGCHDTHFSNPHGLDEAAHLTTALDLAKILWEAIEYDLYREVAGTPSYTITENLSVKDKISLKHTVLQLQSGSPYYDSRVICAKTGTEDAAGYCLATYASDPYLDLICIILGDSSKENAAGETNRLLNYAFENFRLSRLPLAAGTLGTDTWDLDGDGISQAVEYIVGWPNTVTDRNTALVPATMINSELKDFVRQTEEGGYEIVYTLGGVEIVSYPLTITYMEEIVPPTESETETETETESETETEPPTEESTEESTEAPTEESTEPSSSETEPVTEPSTEAPTEPTTEATPAPTEAPSTAAPTAAPTEPATTAPSQEPESTIPLKTLLLIGIPFLVCALALLALVLILSSENKRLRERIRRVMPAEEEPEEPDEPKQPVPDETQPEEPEEAEEQNEEEEV